jgi:hypothetical protein
MTKLREDQKSYMSFAKRRPTFPVSFNRGGRVDSRHQGSFEIR